MESTNNPGKIQGYYVQADGSTSALCHLCREIDFRRLFFSSMRPDDDEKARSRYGTGDRIELDSRYLGLPNSTDTVSESTKCPLCSFVRRHVSARTKSGPGRFPPTVWQHRFGILDHYSYFSYGPIDEGDSTALTAFGWPYCIEARLDERVSVERKGRSTDQTNLAMKLIGSLSPELPGLGFESFLTGGELPLKHYATGRIRPLHCNTQLIKAWLGMCEQKHSLCRLNKDDTIYGLKLFNVHSLRVVSVEEDEITPFPRYVALSYVWGGSQKVYLGKDNLHELHRVGLKSIQDLHPAIRDAIQVLREIGETYLWVDSLCLTQDSLEEMQQQIPQMGRIFQRATMTIIAAPDGNSNLGLPGMIGNPARDPQWVLRLDDMALVTPTTEESGPTIDVTRESLWQTRAWTVQEALLSRRRVVFTSEQVYFSCKTGDWCEDMHLESSVYSRDREYALPHQNQLSLSTVSLLSESKHVFTIAFQEFVMKYSRSRLTHEEDRLAAITGILSTIEEQSKAQHRFIWGLLAAEFETHLCWEHNTADWVDDTASQKLLQPHPDVNTCFPSYSWLGWCGPTGYESRQGYIKLPYRDSVEPTIQCYRFLILSDGGKQSENDDRKGKISEWMVLDRISAPLAPDAPWVKGSLEVAEFSLDPALRNLPLWQLTQLCCFWSSVVPVSREHLLATTMPNMQFPATLDGVDGEIFMRNWDPGYLTDKHGEYELVMIGWEMEKLGGPPEREGQLVLLVRRSPEDPIARRVGLGEVRPMGAWMLARPEWKLIVLG